MNYIKEDIKNKLDKYNELIEKMKWKLIETAPKGEMVWLLSEYNKIELGIFYFGQWRPYAGSQDHYVIEFKAWQPLIKPELPTVKYE